MKTPRRTVRLLCLIGSLAGTRCGGAVDRQPSPPVGDASFDATGEPPPRGTLPTVAGDVAWVPGGSVFVGEWVPGLDGGLERQTECGPLKDGGTAKGNRRLVTRTVSLMVDQLTVAGYSPCVAAGVCPAPVRSPYDPVQTPLDDPGQATLPVRLVIDDAAKYCGWAGGRLPTFPELTRAAIGDGFFPGYPGLAAQVSECVTERSDAASCVALSSWTPYGNESPAWTYQQPSPIRSLATDVGPFGHYDLFSGLWECSSSYYDLPFAEFCGLRDGDPDPGPMTVSGANPFLAGGAIGSALIMWESKGFYGTRADLESDGFAVTNFLTTGLYPPGVRCAFDPR